MIGAKKAGKLDLHASIVRANKKRVNKRRVKSSEMKRFPFKFL